MSSSISEKLSLYYKKNEKKALEDYFTFLKFKSISSEPTYKKELLDCANWVIDYLKKMNFDVEVWETSHHPVIFASLMKAGPEKPTLLIYNHYDVQPVDPFEKWISPPFEPTIRDGEVFARGAQDNKGQCFYTLFAVKAYLELFKELPINVKFCIEGEEECGSIGLTEILNEKKDQLKADYLAVVDMGIKNPNSPAVTLGVRGIITMDVIVTGTNTDLHSGSHGGIAYNPIHALVNILSAIRNENGQIQVPGFYDEVIPLTDEQKKLITFDFDEIDYVKTFGKKATGGESGFTPHERSWTRPTLEVNGINGGYSGEGFKTVIPSIATAKISCRLVPNQKPKDIAEKVRNYLIKKAPSGVDIDVIVHDGFGAAVRADPNSKAVIAFADAYREVFNKPCAFIYSGGSIPVIERLADVSQAEVVLMGLGLPDDQIHAPNEHFGVDRLEKGFNIIGKTLENLGK